MCQRKQAEQERRVKEAKVRVFSLLVLHFNVNSIGSGTNASQEKERRLKEEKLAQQRQEAEAERLKAVAAKKNARVNSSLPPRSLRHVFTICD